LQLFKSHRPLGYPELGSALDYQDTLISLKEISPKGFFPSFKTLDLVADQSSAANLTYALNFRKSKIYKGKLTADFFGGPPKINRGT
jgi:hypothetical protein